MKPALGIRRCPRVQLTLEVKYPTPAPPTAQGTERPCSPATSFHPTMLRAHWTPSPCAGLSPARSTTGPPPRPGGNSGRCACPEPRRARRAPPGRFPRSPQTSRQGRRPAIPLWHRHAATATRRAAPPTRTSRTDETVLNRDQDRVPQQPIAASFGAGDVSRGFNHWFVSCAFLPRYRARPAGGGPLLRRQGLLPPIHHTSGSGCPQLQPTVTAAGGGPSSHPVIWRLVAYRRARQPL